jgi:uncharacterized protein (DUF3084 family)
MANSSDLLTDCATGLGRLSSATINLTSALEYVSEVAKRIEERFKELDEKEVFLKDLAARVLNQKQEIDAQGEQLKEKDTSINRREKDVVEKEERWLETEKHMILNATKQANKILINVGMLPCCLFIPHTYC